MNSPIRVQSRLRRHSSAFDAPLHDDLVVTQADTETYFGLAKTGKRIWDLLGSPMTAGELCDLLAREFDVENTGTIELDVFSFLAELEDAGLIVIER